MGSKRISALTEETILSSEYFFPIDGESGTKKYNLSSFQEQTIEKTIGHISSETTFVGNVMQRGVKFDTNPMVYLEDYFNFKTGHKYFIDVNFRNYSTTAYKPTVNGEHLSTSMDGKWTGLTSTGSSPLDFYYQFEYGKDSSVLSVNNLTATTPVGIKCWDVTEGMRYQEPFKDEIPDFAFVNATKPYVSRNVTYLSGANTSTRIKGDFRNDTISSIGRYAFYYNSEVSSLTIPNCLSIGERSLIVDNDPIYVACVYDDYIYYSNDIINWSKASVSKDYFTDVIYGNGMFVAICKNEDSTIKYVYVSSDGITWEQKELNVDITQVDYISFGNGIFIFSGQSSGSSAAYKTSDFESFESINEENVKGKKIKFVGDYFYSFNGYISQNGDSWEKVNFPVDSIQDIVYGNGVYVIILSSKDSSNNISYFSLTGKSYWTRRYVPSAGLYNSICFGNGHFVTYSNSVGYSKMYVDYFDTNNKAFIEGKTQTFPYTPSSTGLFINNYRLIFQNDIFIIGTFGDSAGYMYYSYDGLNWIKTGKSGTSYLQKYFYGICCGNKNKTFKKIDFSHKNDNTIPTIKYNSVGGNQYYAISCYIPNSLKDSWENADVWKDLISDKIVEIIGV